MTGASRGIGLAIAARLVADGARVAITARKPEALEEAVAELGADRAIAIAGNAGDIEHQQEVVERVLAEWGRLDFLVNNTGINPAYGPLTDLDLEVKIERANNFPIPLDVAAGTDPGQGQRVPVGSTVTLFVA